MKMPSTMRPMPARFAERVWAAEAAGEADMTGGRSWRLERLGAVRLHHDGVERRGPADVETVALDPAEHHVRHHLGHQHLADERPVRRVAMDAVPGARPEPPRLVEAEAVEEPRRRGGEDLAP